MNLHSRLVLGSALLIVFPGSVFGDCVDADRLLADAQNGFAQIQASGEDRDRGGTLSRLPGATYCSLEIEESAGEPWFSYYCTWEYGRFVTIDENHKQAEALLEGLWKCFQAKGVVEIEKLDAGSRVGRVQASVRYPNILLRTHVGKNSIALWADSWAGEP